MRIVPLRPRASLREELRSGTGAYPRLCWLGQAGFALRLPWPSARVILIDPYLSDFLAYKYRGHRFDHARLMPAPIAVEDLPGIDLVLCTHRHSDHMDPWSLPRIAEASPECRFVVPRPDVDRMADLGVPVERIVPAEPGRALRPIAEVEIHPVPAAHEDLASDGEGGSRDLGYVIMAARCALYHSGDCVPFPGLVDLLRARWVDVALLPVNGRDAERSAQGFPGNFTWREALDLCTAAGIPWLVPHHFGMFAFNDVDPTSLVVGPPGVEAVIPRIGCCCELRADEERCT